MLELDSKTYLTRNEAAALLSMSATGIDKLIRRCGVTRHRIGKYVYVEQHELEAAVVAMSSNAQSQRRPACNVKAD